MLELVNHVMFALDAHVAGDDQPYHARVLFVALPVACPLLMSDVYWRPAFDIASCATVVTGHATLHNVIITEDRLAHATDGICRIHD